MWKFLNLVLKKSAPKKKLLHYVINLIFLCDKYDGGIYWIARAYLSLPLPLGWKCYSLDDCEGSKYWINMLNKK